MNRQPLIIHSISELLRRLGQPKPLHPLIALINYSDVKIGLTDAGRNFSLDFYKISFKSSFKGQVKYGQGYYDFEEGGLAFLAPNQMVTMSADEANYEGYSLFFHPDLIRPYPLSNTIHQYGFFSYAITEALCLSDKEKQVIAAIFEAIERELGNNIDYYSQDVLVSQIELLLNHSNRFYHRQFLTRKAVYHDLIGQMEAWLINRFQNENTILPSVQEVADRLNVSPRYLSDMLKSLTGQSTQQHIHNKLVERAKDLLARSDSTIAEIAYGLGFEHPQSFNKLFKQKTEQSPLEFRQSFN
ncbi:transcriptional regulator, AraC family [Mucilaginibacter pineti]|uniref:Transcriptional regulator, AraC family n=1 Tax=Mucilaginibacter pineti TaxID=1391627 RepID=A0A1G6U2E2_9SPHI|nr:AraC family transcriptional regulator [Mucilaginibacter pineti]SDD35519.1 transcriptional regulator, AraC family [Mucilaginibacter pineti]